MNNEVLFTIKLLTLIVFVALLIVSLTRLIFRIKDRKLKEEYLNPKEKEYIDGMREYINKLKALPKDEAEKEARKALIESGVLNDDGTPKERIVTYE